jgi:hypothetical protein
MTAEQAPFSPQSLSTLQFEGTQRLTWVQQ